MALNGLCCADVPLRNYSLSACVHRSRLIPVLAQLCHAVVLFGAVSDVFAAAAIHRVEIRCPPSRHGFCRRRPPSGCDPITCLCRPSTEVSAAISHSPPFSVAISRHSLGNWMTRKGRGRDGGSKLADVMRESAAGCGRFPDADVFFRLQTAAVRLPQLRCPCR